MNADIGDSLALEMASGCPLVPSKGKDQRGFYAPATFLSPLLASIKCPENFAWTRTCTPHLSPEDPLRTQMKLPNTESDLPPPWFIKDSQVHSDCQQLS